MSAMPKQTVKKSRIRLLHQYYSYTGFYAFVKSSVGKAIIPIVVFIVALWIIHAFVIDFDDLFTSITTTFSPIAILSVFFASESILGLIPPEIFIAWSKKTADPLLNLSLLATLSYLGGLTAYFIGRSALKIKSIKNYLEVKMAKNLKNTSKWGGILILVGALLPLPFAISCLTAGMIKYPFKKVVFFGLFRFLRFAIYAWAIFSMVN